LPEFRVTCESAAPLLMHNGQLIDPLSAYSKDIAAVSGKNKKTDADHLEMMRLEFLGGLYYDPEVGPFIPAENLRKCLIEGARFRKEGKDIERGVFLTTIVNRLDYGDFPRDPEALLEHPQFVNRVPVTVGRAKVMRTRPHFPSWSVTAQGWYNDEVIKSVEVLDTAFQTAGSLVGLCDRRPTYGRFTHTLEVIG